MPKSTPPPSFRVKLLLLSANELPTAVVGFALKRVWLTPASACRNGVVLELTDGKRTCGPAVKLKLSVLSLTGKRTDVGVNEKLTVWRRKWPSTLPSRPKRLVK